MSTPSDTSQVAEKSILDFYNRQTYLGNTYILTSNKTTIGTTSETPLVLFRNLANSKKALFMVLRKLICLTTGQSALFNFYSGSTIISNGSPILPNNLRSGSTNTSVAAISLDPSISNFGTLIGTLACNDVSQIISTLLYIIDPGSSLLMTVQVSQAATIIISENVWYEL